MNNLCDRLKRAGAELVPDGADGLRIRAPRPLPPDMVADLRALRDDLLDVYREHASIREIDGNTPRAEAERLAAADALEWLAGHCRPTCVHEKPRLPARVGVAPIPRQGTSGDLPGRTLPNATRAKSLNSGGIGRD